MPGFQDIDVAVAIGPDWARLSEYHHPDGSSIRDTASPTDWQFHDKIPDHSSPTSQPRTSHRASIIGARVSVYIPSVPGSQFGILYSIAQSSEPPAFYYFKAFINGRNVTNWGVDPAEKSTGVVHRALYEPGHKWHYRANGVTLKRQGIEARSFYFLPFSTSSTVADDGGLIEIQVFRAKGRKRRAIMLDQHRDQGKYGIASPSTGLLENPEEATYYDWILCDPKHRPLATFCFHYRSPSNLQLLHLWRKEDESITWAPSSGAGRSSHHDETGSAYCYNDLNSPPEPQQHTNKPGFKLESGPIAAISMPSVRMGGANPHHPLEQSLFHMTANVRLPRPLPEVPDSTESLWLYHEGNLPTHGDTDLISSAPNELQLSNRDIPMRAEPGTVLSPIKSNTCLRRPLSPVLENQVQQTYEPNALDLTLDEGQWMKGHSGLKTLRRHRTGTERDISAGDEDDEMF